MPRVEISVIIVNWNGRHDLDECLAALGRQTFRKFDVWVIDNGSKDGSVAFVRQHYPNVHVIAMNSNTGFCHANNIGMTKSQGRFIALLNNDAVPAADWLERLHAVMESKKSVGIAVGRIVRNDKPDILDTAGDGFDICGVGFRRGHGKPAACYPNTEEVFGACAAAALYRRSMLERIGCFEDYFFAVGEDIDLSLRARLAGFSCVYHPAAVVRHKISRTVRAGSKFQFYHSRRNVEYVYLRNLPTSLLLVCLPLHLAYEAMTFLQAVQEGRLALFWRAKADVWRARKRLLRDRSCIQQLRKVSVLSLLRFFSWSYLLLRLKGQEMIATSDRDRSGSPRI